MSNATHVERTPASPELPRDFAIALAVEPVTHVRGALVLAGAFNLPLAEADALGHPVQHAIVLVIQHGDAWNVVTPFRELVLFPDDERATPGGVGGWFQIDVFAAQGGPMPGYYQLFVSMGERVSPVVEVAVRA
ncbi:MAG: hypothetical protein IT373_05140 [Polyangiaceae bacterium]|nr:hypothetical protein [Polyangiaceae bacterium]